MYATVLIMSPKAQFVRCMFYVILYITICFLLLKVKYFYRAQQHGKMIVKDIRLKEKCVSNVPDVNKTPINMEIKLLEDDEMNGQSINVQESAAILRKVSEVCLKGKLQTPIIKRHFLYSPRHKSLYCWIRKVASTSFTKLFSNMRSDDSVEYYRSKSAPTPKRSKDLQLIAKDVSVFKLLVVRHPFQRLVSSYRDRIEDNSRHTAQAWVYTKKMFRLTRPKLFRSNTTTGNFLQRVFTADRRLKVIPTFREFVHWLLQSSENDVHWDTYYTHCAVCNISYNYILKLDEYTFGEINYIFSKFQLEVDQMYLPKLEQTRGGYTDFDTACKYFKTLTSDMIFELYERYKIDFEMYNYDYKKYMFCGNKKV